MIQIRFEDHPADTNAVASPPQLFTPMLGDNERVICVETTKDPFGYATARVWIERTL